MDPKAAKSEWKFGTRAYQAGESVFREGDMGIEAYIVQSGEIEIRKSMGPGQDDVLLGSLGEGAIFGEMALVDDECRMASAVCSRHAVLRVIPVDVFEAKYAGADPFIRALIRVLVRNARASNRALSCDQLLDQTQSRDWSPFERSVDVLVGRLRKKIEADPKKPQFIKTVRGVGYVFAERVRRVAG